jgi:putative drug exporter of the RND superfamily
VAVLLASAMVLSLAPAMLTLFGGAVWRLPGWLARLLPHVDIEGESEPHPPRSRRRSSRRPRERLPPRNRFDAPVLFSGI